MDAERNLRRNLRSHSAVVALLAACGAPSVLAAAGGPPKLDLHVEIERLRNEVQHEEQRTQAILDSTAATRTELMQVNASLAAVRQKLREAREEADWRRECTGEVRLLCWLESLPHQRALAAAAGLIGGFALLGPPGLRVAFSAACGSALGSMLFLGCALTVWATVAPAAPSEALLPLPLQLGRLLAGGAPAPCYWAWLALLACSLLPWVGTHGRRRGTSRAASKVPPAKACQHTEGDPAAGSARGDPGPRDHLQAGPGPPGAGVGPLPPEPGAGGDDWERPAGAGNSPDRPAAGGAGRAGASWAPRHVEGPVQTARRGSFGGSVARMLRCSARGRRPEAAAP
ncbi:unnamed protein product [Prorocentrum cordatum]|uniref:Vesicle transport protein n=1 Tax=Prorocentrum cordatum TaxID=2364126 RepID=A0ABN9RX61_9DINO|nr:unnamed protein product [Polarella glacialis]